MNEEQATKLIRIYGKAWVNQDPDLALSVFTEDATYFDPAEPMAVGHEGIRDYWQKKVVEGQKDIFFKLIDIEVEGNLVLAKWNSRFVDLKRNLVVYLKEVAIFTVKDGKFSSIREYYQSKKEPYEK